MASKIEMLLKLGMVPVDVDKLGGEDGLEVEIDVTCGLVGIEFEDDFIFQLALLFLKSVLLPLIVLDFDCTLHHFDSQFQKHTAPLYK